MQLKDYTVRTKIIAVTGCMLAAALLFGVFSGLQIYRLNTNSAELRDHWLPATRVIGELRYQVTRFRAMTGMYMLCSTDEERATQEKRLDARLLNLNAAMQKLDSEMVSDRERALSRDIHEAWAAYEPMYHNLLDMQKTKGHEAAAYYLRIPMREPFERLNNALDAAIAYENKGGVAAGNASQSTFEWSVIWNIVSVAVILALCFGAAVVLIKAVSAPLVRITAAMGELAGGHLDAHVPHADQQDEIGKLAGAMTSFKNQLAAAERSKAEQVDLIVGSVGAGLAQLAKGDVTHRIATVLTGPFAKLKDDFNTAMEHLQETLKKVLSGASQIAGGAGEISQAADDLSRRTEQQAASLEETAAALEEITATVKRTAANAKEARTNVASTKLAAEAGGKVVDTAIHAMDGIAQSSKQITDIIGVIDEIAFQTNLLALNAGVEAARAGDAGKGFAVVATEVRELAGRSGEAAKKIKALISASGEQVEAGVKLVGESGTALRAIVDQVQTINQLVSEMAQAAEQQSVGIEQVNAAVSQMDQVTQQNAAMVEQSTAAARNLAGETRNLEEQVAFFNVGGSERTSAARAVTPARSVSEPAARATASRQRARRTGTGTLTSSAIDGDWTEF